MATLLTASFWTASQPPSAEAVMVIFLKNHDSWTQLVQLYHTDQVGMIVHKNGSIFPTDAVDQLPTERLELYRVLMRESGVTRSLGGNFTKKSFPFKS